MVRIIILSLLCICLILSSIGIVFFKLDGDSELVDDIQSLFSGPPDETVSGNPQDDAYQREMGKIVADMTDEQEDTVAEQQNLSVALKALERAKFNASNVGNAFKTVSESSQKLAEGKAQLIIYEGLANNSTSEDERALWQEAADETQKKIDFFQSTYDEAKKAADEAAAALIEKAAAEKAAAEQQASLAEQQRKEAAATREAQRKAQELATLKEGCKNVVWNNVFVDGRVGVDIFFANGTSIGSTPPTGVTKGNAKVTVTTAKKTIFSKREQTGQNSYGWRSKAEYDGIVQVNGDKVGYIKMKKKPSSQQPSSCKDNRPTKRNCAFEPDGFEELHDFNDTTKPLLLMHHKGYTGVMQGETGKFYSFQDKNVIDNPYSGDCQRKLDYK